MTDKKTIFSGIQPTGQIHLGNYFGAVSNWVKLQEDYNCIYSIVDYHAITIDHDPDQLRDNKIKLAAMLIACGIDPKKSILFVQSDVPTHTELAWIFDTLTPLGELERMTQFKDKAQLAKIEQQAFNIKKMMPEVIKLKKENPQRKLPEMYEQLLKLYLKDQKTGSRILDFAFLEITSKQKNKSNAGLFTYPVLQAADILLYKSGAVPVGEDQLQHIELTRKIARKFNRKFGDYFVEPEALQTPATRVMSLSDPESKMSKSHGDKSYISLEDSPEIIRKKIAKAVTDSNPDGSMSAGVKNLFNLLKYAGGDPQIIQDFETAHEASTLKYSELKMALADQIIKLLAPIQKKYNKLIASPDKIERILTKGAKQAQKLASQNITEIKKLIGLS